MPTSSLDRHRKNQRRRSRNRYFERHPGIISKCFHCGTKIVWLSKIAKEDRLNIDDTKFKATIRINGVPIVLKIASLDHIVPLRDNGSEGLYNVVPSCVPCNKDRDQDVGIQAIKRCGRCNRLMRGRKIYCKSCRKYRFENMREIYEKRSIHLGRS